jgi:hypothetical protein
MMMLVDPHRFSNISANRSDNFNRTDTTSGLGSPSDGGSAWVQLSGTWGIIGTRAYESASAAEAVCYLETGASDATVQVTFATPGANAGLAFRITDINNFLLFTVSNSTDTYYLYKKVAGSYSLLGTWVATPGFAVVQASMIGSAIEIRVDGVLRIAVTETHNLSATKHGLRSSSSVASRYDDFSVTI